MHFPNISQFKALHYILKSASPMYGIVVNPEAQFWFDNAPARWRKKLIFSSVRVKL